MRKGHFMKEKEDFFTDIRRTLGKKISSELSRLAYEIEELLSNLTLKEIKDTQAWIDETIDMYYQEELDNAIKNAMEFVEYEEDEDGYYSSFNPYLTMITKDEYGPNIDLIMEDFNVEVRNPDCDSAALEWLLSISYRSEGLVDGIKNYQIMAIMALDYIERFMNGDSSLRDNSFDNDKHYCAFWIYFTAKEMKYSLEVESIRLDAQKEMKVKAAEARHSENKKMKALIRSKWQIYKNQKLKEGKKPSKNAFAKKIYSELLEAHKRDPKVRYYEEKTIRSNWLQGI